MKMTPNPMSWRSRGDLVSRPWKGAKREYDLFKELTVGVIVIGLAVVGLSAVFGSPDEPSVSLKSWAQTAPADFVATATAELGGTSGTAGYGPPYNSTPGTTQAIGPIDLQRASGVRIPINTAVDFVTRPLSTLPQPPASLSTWSAATTAQQTAWTAAYTKALTAAQGNDPAQVAPGDYGPVPSLTSALLAMARSGNLDGVLQGEGGFFTLDYTRSILFLGDGNYFNDLATKAHLTGDQWGVMNETGNFPGQSWLWLFSFWYQVPLIAALSNVDTVVVGIMLLLTLLLTFVPFIPVLRTLPRWIPVHKLVWKDYYSKR